VKFTKTSTLPAVAAAVAKALAKESIRAVLTGGACASLYTRGVYQSSDLDFVLQSVVPVARLDAALATVGFRRRGNHYEHQVVPFFVVFPAGPLGIGSDLGIRPVRRRVGPVSVTVLSATDSCRDRLAAFYHWQDRQSLAVAVGIAVRNPVDLKAIKRWSRAEGAAEGMNEFLAALAQARRRRRLRLGPRSRRT